MSGETRYRVPGLERGLRLLQCFSRDRPVATLADLGRELDLPRTTVFRLAQTLEHMGFLQRAEGSRDYRLGPAVLGLGFEFLASLEITELARTLAASGDRVLVLDFGQQIALGTPDEVQANPDVIAAYLGSEFA